MVTRIGGNFKETLRQSGGLDNIFNVMVNCHSELEVRPHFCGTFLFLTGLDKTINLALFVLLWQRIMNFGTLFSGFNMLRAAIQKKIIFGT